MDFVVDPQSFASFLDPYCPGGAETQNGDQFYVRVDVGSTAREARGWSFEPYELNSRDSLRAAMDILDRIVSEPQTPERAWAKVYRRQAQKATKILELTGRPEQEKAAQEPLSAIDRAWESANGGKLLGVFMKSQADTALMVIKGQQSQIETQLETIHDLRAALDSAVTKWEKTFTEKEDLRAKLVVLEVKMGMFIVEAVKDVLPKFAEGFNSYAKSKGRAAEQEAENKAKGEQESKAAEEAAADPNAPEKVPTVEELTDGMLEALGVYIQKNPQLLTGERLDAFMKIIGTGIQGLGSAALGLLTKDRWLAMRDVYQRAAKVAQMQGFPV